MHCMNRGSLLRGCGRSIVTINGGGFNIMASRYECIISTDFLISQPKHNVGTQKNHVNETGFFLRYTTHILTDG